MACLPRQPLDGRATAAQLVLEPLEAAVEVVDAIDDGYALGRERRDHERHRSPQIGCHHRRTFERRYALDGGALTVEMDARAEPREFADMHEAVFEDG